MASEIDICNSALYRVGSERITSLSDNTKASKICNDMYYICRDNLLRMHPWNFAKKRQTLAATSTTPTFDWQYEFQLPSDCIRVLDIYDNEAGDVKFVVEGKKLLANESSIKILYLSNAVSVDDFDPSFREALALRLASDICFALTNSSALTESLETRYNNHLRDARLFNAQEGNNSEFFKSEWTEARL